MLIKSLQSEVLLDSVHLMHDVSNISVKVLSLLQVARISNEWVRIPKGRVRVNALRGNFQATLNMALPNYDWMSRPVSEVFW